MKLLNLKHIKKVIVINTKYKNFGGEDPIF